MKIKLDDGKKTLILIVIGMLFTALSFIYEFAINNKSFIISWALIIVDILLFLINVLFINSNNKPWKRFINFILVFIFYISSITGIVLIKAKDKASIDLMIMTMKILVYLGPLIIIVAPIVVFIFYCMGQS